MRLQRGRKNVALSRKTEGGRSSEEDHVHGSRDDKAVDRERNKRDTLNQLQEGFEEFFKTTVNTNPLKGEYLIPSYIGELLQQGKITVKVLKSNDTWYGMTYKEDVAVKVKNGLERRNSIVRKIKMMLFIK